MTDNNNNNIHQVTFRMKKDMLRKLKVYAAQNDITVTTIMNQLVENYLDDNIEYPLDEIAKKMKGKEKK
jgi:predicted DNA-binding protein